MMDGNNQLVCPECDFRFEVIWQLDAMCIMGEQVICYCPRCGEELPEYD